MEAEMGETLAKVMHINDVNPCVKIGRFDAQLFQIKIRLSFSWNLATVHSAAAERPGSRQAPLLRPPPQPPPPPPTLCLFSFFFFCEF